MNHLEFFLVIIKWRGSAKKASLRNKRSRGTRDTIYFYIGVQVPQGALPSLYSCSATSKTPNQRVTTKKSLIFRETVGDDVDTAHPGHQEPSRALPSQYSCSATDLPHKMT
ncbi:hypothetical protein TSAR_005324 [Trichomalopsis sarcophagae]|uniref:Uncharacterized protein n=1 Tax=Trichomalopsis sarcophagae TaxID=543379 RepID=A0A232F2T5_9HYME|nr:hypothetical protein TSAR_005324 [Trichomalopsis sarcophagae]